MSVPLCGILQLNRNLLIINSQQVYCLSWDSNSHLLATVARHQLNKKGGHSSEEDRQKLFTEACERYQLSGKILLADCDWAGTPVYR